MATYSWVWECMGKKVWYPLFVHALKSVHADFNFSSSLWSWYCPNDASALAKSDVTVPDSHIDITRAGSQVQGPNFGMVEALLVYSYSRAQCMAKDCHVCIGDVCLACLKFIFNLIQKYFFNFTILNKMSITTGCGYGCNMEPHYFKFLDPALLIQSLWTNYIDHALLMSQWGHGQQSRLHYTVKRACNSHSP